MLKVDLFITKLIDDYISLLTAMYNAEKREMHNKTNALYWLRKVAIQLLYS